ncbi:hypothetical protein EON79_13460 [bacterium]|nr:MAG: hypothetical protein EON79_13460 [bacterium]
MRYFVISDDGSRYGPADVATLKQWALEGRVQSHLFLEEETGGRRLLASQVPGLDLLPPVTAGYGANGTVAYPRPVQPVPQGTSVEIIAAWVFGLFGLVCGFFGIFFAICGLVSCYLAQKKGYKAMAPRILNVVCLTIWAILLLFSTGISSLFRG